MDPLSITAGSLAFLSAGGKVVEQLKKLITLRHAPDELLALNNEVSDICSVIHDTEDLLRRQLENGAASVPPDLTRALERSKASVEALEKFLAYDVTVISSSDNRPRVDKSRWLRKMKQLENHKERLKDNRSELSRAHSIMAA